MTFATFSFVGFLVVVLAAYNTVTQRKRAVVLVVAGYVFCAFASWQAAIVLAAITGATYAFARALVKRPRRWLAIVGVIAILSPLILLKGLTQFGELMMAGNIASLAFPLGLSFYTLQAVGYVLDVYRQRFPAERNFLAVTLYLAFFPILQSGPIERAGGLIAQLFSLHRTEATIAFLAGKQILWGFFCKLVIADKIAIVVSDIFSRADEQRGPVLAVGLALFALQLYFDFYGYTNIAIGIARLFGIQITPNFNHPYLAISLQDFWHRWHISLSTWFRDFVYLPLGGRKNRNIRFAAIVVFVFVLSGLWHGLTVNFLAWGIIHALLYLAGRMTAPFREKSWELVLGDRMRWLRCSVQRITVFVLVALLWVFFLVPTWPQAMMILRSICNLEWMGSGLAFVRIFGRLDFFVYILWAVVFFAADSAGIIGCVLDKIPKHRLEIARELAVLNCLAILLILTGDIGSKGFIYMYF
jgi:alginate O-acetyltransferase complex protein AlgI